MRFSLVCAFCVCAWPSVGWSQTYRIHNEDSIPRHSLPVVPIGGGHSHGRGDNGRPCHGPSLAPGYGFGGYYGPGYGFTFANQSPFGFNYGAYSSISYGVPGFSVGYSAPLFGNTYYGPAWGDSAWNPPIYSAPPVYVSNRPTLPPLPQWMIDEANAANQPVNRAKPISQTHRSLIQPSTPEAQLRSVRLQDAGDRLFSSLDYSAAEKAYAKSLQAAPDRPEPYVRLAVAKAARGDYRAAVSYLRQMADVDASYPARVDSLDRLFGHQNRISKLQLKQRVADWTKIDVRDPDRIFLLGIMLFLDGDDRFRTLLGTAEKLEGDQPYLRAFLEAVPAREVTTPAPTPDEIDALTAPAPVPTPAEGGDPTTAPPPLLLPGLPDPPAP